MLRRTISSLLTRLLFDERTEFDERSVGLLRSVTTRTEELRVVVLPVRVTVVPLRVALVDAAEPRCVVWPPCVPLRVGAIVALRSLGNAFGPLHPGFPIPVMG